MIFVLTFLAFALVVGAMSVGVMAGRDPIKGSCGGIGALGIDQSCDICGGDPNKCDEQSDSALAYDATSADKDK